MKGVIQSLLDDHDTTLTRVYYTSPEQFNQHYNTVENQVFKHNKNVKIILHIIKKVREQ